MAVVEVVEEVTEEVVEEEEEDNEVEKIDLQEIILCMKVVEVLV